MPPLSEADRADVEAFLDEMLLIYPVVGVAAFESVAGDVPDLEFRLAGPGTDGRGRETPDGFVVLAGSIARHDQVPSIHAYLSDLRQGLLAEGVLIASDDGLRFTQDYLFKSPSTAAGVLLGRAANGRTEWRLQDGQTLKAVQTAEVGAQPTAQSV